MVAKVVIRKSASTGLLSSKRISVVHSRGQRTPSRSEVILAILACGVLLLLGRQLYVLSRHTHRHNGRPSYRSSQHLVHKHENTNDDEGQPHTILEPAHRVPDDFVWHTYLRLHPDVLKSGINNEKGAKAHFVQHGRQEGRAYKLPKLYLQYTACRGFSEQIYSHMSAMVLSSKLGPAELMWPPLLVDDAEGPNGYGSGDAEGVWDLEGMRQWWQREEVDPMLITKSQSSDLPPALLLHPTTVDWDRAFPAERDPDTQDGQFVHAEGLFESLRTARRVTDALIAKVGKLQTDSGAGLDGDYEALVRLPCLFWALRTDSVYQTLAQKVVPSLAFNRHVQQLAQKAVDALGTFDALIVHNDSDVRALTGRHASNLKLYIRDLKPRFSGQTCFVVFEYATLEESDFDKMSDTLAAQGLCAQALTQDDVVKQRELDRLNSEQLSLLDMLIAMQAQVVGGSYWSLTTLLIRELRYMRESLPRSTVVRVNDTGQHLYTAEQLFYGGLLDEPDAHDKTNVQDLPFTMQQRPML